MERLIKPAPGTQVDRRAGDVLEMLEGAGPYTVAEVAVCDGDRLVGLISLERLLAADRDMGVGTLVDGRPPTTTVDADPEALAWQAARAGARSVAVVDVDDRFSGSSRPSGCWLCLRTSTRRTWPGWAAF